MCANLSSWLVLYKIHVFFTMKLIMTNKAREDNMKKRIFKSFAFASSLCNHSWADVSIIPLLFHNGTLGVSV